MIKVKQSNRFSRTSAPTYPLVGVSSSNISYRSEDFQKKVAEGIAHMRRNDRPGDESKDFDDVHVHDHMMLEPDDSQPLAIEPPLTLSKICSKLTAVERLWLARMVKAHGKKLVLARWPAYEIHINFVRYLR